MKKLFTILFFIIVLFNLVGCMKKKDYMVLEVDCFDATSKGKHKAEYTLRDNTEIESVLNEKYSDSQMDKNRQATYKYTKNQYFFNSDMYVYESDNGDFIYGINKENGRLDRFSDYSEENVDNAKKMTRDECLALVKEYIEQYVDDFSEYELYYETKYDFEIAKYYFAFARMKNGIKTSDQIYVRVSEYGKICYYQFASLGEMKNEKIPSEKELKNIEKKVDEKLNDIYGEMQDGFIYEKENVDMTFAKMSDGHLAMIYDIAVKIVNKDNKEMYYTELTKLIIFLDE